MSNNSPIHKNPNNDRVETLTDTQSAVMRKWEELFVRYMTLANAGGIIAILTFIGTTWEQSFPKWLVIIPLFSFICGLAFSGLTVLYAYFHYKELIESQNTITVGPVLSIFEVPGIILKVVFSWSYKAAIVFLSLGLISGFVALTVTLLFYGSGGSC